jgi:hypothetical protein
MPRSIDQTIDAVRYETRHSFLKAVLGRDKRSIYPDNLAFFPEINVVFNRVKKSGNTSIFLYLSEVCGDEPEKLRDSERAKYLRSICCRRFSEIARIKSMNSLLCVRSPYSRALSGFLQKVGTGNMRKYSGYGGFAEPDQSGFEAFLRDIAERPLGQINRHFWPQSKLVFQRPENFTYVAKLESIAEDMKKFFEQIGVRSDIWLHMHKPHSIEYSQSGKITKSKERGDLISDEARRMIESIYVEDFEIFSY